MSSLVENIIRSSIFLVIAVQGLFPSNAFLPFDRRLCSLLGAALCITCDRIFSPNNTAKNALLVQAGQHIDMFVILILLSIMVINFVIIGQPMIIKLLKLSNSCIRKNRRQGFWIISAIAFIVSPILMNDGVCILLVEPVLSAFVVEDSEHERKTSVPHSIRNGNSEELFFLLAVACSANIGSVCTFTGNPQNILIGESLGEGTMGFGQFVLLMVLPATICWVITTAYLDHCRASVQSVFVSSSTIEQQTNDIGHGDDEDDDHGSKSLKSSGYTASLYKEYTLVRNSGDGDGVEMPVIISTCKVEENSSRNGAVHSTSSDDNRGGDTTSAHTVIADVDAGQSRRRESRIAGSSPALTSFWLVILLAMEFSGAVSLAAAYVLVAVFLVSSTLLSNYYSDVIFRRSGASSQEKRIKDITQYVEELFNDIDYNIICIFIGLFIVAGSFLQTGIPTVIWKYLAGKLPTSSLGYMLVLCLFVTVASQLIGNVPVVYMAREQLLYDGDLWHRRYSGLLLAWVSTVAGNFTLVGSAANIIVAEKAMRYKYRPMLLTAAFHFQHCAAITLMCIGLGASILYLEALIAF